MAIAKVNMALQEVSRNESSLSRSWCQSPVSLWYFTSP